MYKQQGVTRNNNKEKSYYFRLKDKTKSTNNKNDLRKKLIMTHKLWERQVKQAEQPKRDRFKFNKD